MDAAAAEDEGGCVSCVPAIACIPALVRKSHSGVRMMAYRVLCKGAVRLVLANSLLRALSLSLT